MRFLLPAFLLVVSGAPAAPLGGGWGLQLGMGAGQFESRPHPTQSNPTNLFSLLAGEIPTGQEADLSGLAGLNAYADWARILEARLELNWRLNNAKTVEDLGSGTKRGTQFTREVLESALLLRLGFPLRAKSGTFRPFAGAGLFGDRTLAARRTIGLVGGDQARVYAWDGVPNEDWGWSAGGGFDFELGARAPRVGLEFRYAQGQKDLDPKGPNEVKARTWMGMLNFSF